MSTTPEKTQAVFTRLTEPDLKLLRRLAKRDKTTGSQIIRELTEKHLARERANQAKAREAAKRQREREWPPATI